MRIMFTKHRAHCHLPQQINKQTKNVTNKIQEKENFQRAEFSSLTAARESHSLELNCS